MSENGKLSDTVNSTNANYTNMDAVEPPTKQHTDYFLNLLNVNYSVKERIGPWWKGNLFRNKVKPVLRDITTQFCNGEITAIVGSSGSGKTSLLDVISGRPEGDVNGKITLNNHHFSKDLVKETTAYVLQADRLLHTLTVRETLLYAAFLRLPGKMSTQERYDKVQRVIQQMGLKNVADSKVGGDVKRGISGGERRRVTIATQLLQNPAIMLLDEPTTGLDSFTAHHLASNLADIAHQGKMIILSIHQPRSDIFKLFDRIMILSNGSMTYCGRGQDIANYFANIGFPCPIYANPLDTYVDISSIDRRSTKREFDTTKIVDSIIESYRKSDKHAEIVKAVKMSINSSGADKLHLSKPKSPNAINILFMLLSRMMVHLGRDRDVYIGRLFLMLTFTPFICFFFWRVGLGPASIQGRYGLIYQTVFTPMYISITNAVMFFPPLRDLYYRESADGLYSIPTFILAYALHIVPFHIMASFLFTIVVYWVTGLYPEWERYTLVLLVVIGQTVIADMLSACILGFVRTRAIAQSACTLVLSTLGLVSSGLLKRVDNMLDILQWIAWIGLPKYITELIMVNEFEKLQFECPPINSSDPCQFTNGTSFLDFAFPDAVDNRMRNIYVGLGFLVFSIFAPMITFAVRGTYHLR